MYEVEVKVQASHEDVRDALDAADATVRGSLKQTDRYFDAPHRDFAARDEALRIRAAQNETGTVTKLTYKGPRLDTATKTRTEHETTIGDAEAMAGALEALGFSQAATVVKRREYYELGPATVTLDHVVGLGQFVEVEIVSKEADIERTQEVVTDTLEQIGLEDAERIRESYLELLLQPEE